MNLGKTKNRSMTESSEKRKGRKKKFTSRHIQSGKQTGWQKKICAEPKSAEKASVKRENDIKGRKGNYKGSTLSTSYFAETLERNSLAGPKTMPGNG